MVQRGLGGSFAAVQAPAQHCTDSNNTMYTAPAVTSASAQIISHDGDRSHHHSASRHEVQPETLIALHPPHRGHNGVPRAVPQPSSQPRNHTDLTPQISPVAGSSGSMWRGGRGYAGGTGRSGGGILSSNSNVVIGPMPELSLEEVQAGITPARIQEYVRARKERRAAGGAVPSWLLSSVTGPSSWLTYANSSVSGGARSPQFTSGGSSRQAHAVVNSSDEAAAQPSLTWFESNSGSRMRRSEVTASPDWSNHSGRTLGHMQLSSSQMQFMPQGRASAGGNIGGASIDGGGDAYIVSRASQVGAASAVSLESSVNWLSIPDNSNNPLSQPSNALASDGVGEDQQGSNKRLDARLLSWQESAPHSRSAHDLGEAAEEGEGRLSAEERKAAKQMLRTAPELHSRHMSPEAGKQLAPADSAMADAAAATAAPPTARQWSDKGELWGGIENGGGKSESTPPDPRTLPFRARMSHHIHEIKEQLVHDLRTVRCVFEEDWTTWALPVLFCLLVLGLGVWAVLQSSTTETARRRDWTHRAALDVNSSMVTSLYTALIPCVTLGQLIRQLPQAGLVNQTFDSFVPDLLGMAPNSVSTLQAAPNGIIRSVYPLTGFNTVLGLDVLKAPDRRPDVLKAILSNALAMSGPSRLVNGNFAIVGRYPVFVPNVLASEDFGRPGETPYGCGDWCYNSTTQTKFWGVTQVTLMWETFAHDSVRLYDLCRGYNFKLTRFDYNATPPADVVIAECPHSRMRTRSPEVFKIDAINNPWTLYIEDERGWVPSWRNGALAADVLGAVLLSTLLCAMLINRRRHLMMLHLMLPKQVIKALSRGQEYAESHESVTILFSDIVSYTNMASEMPPIEIVHMLNEVYGMFDDLCCVDYGCYKVETIGDAFMAVCGCPQGEDPVIAATRIARLAQAMVEYTRVLVTARGYKIRIRVGLNSGPVMGAVVGSRLPHYGLFGNSVNVAARMETNSAPMRIHISASTAELLLKANELYDTGFLLESRGMIDIKGKGQMETFWLDVHSPDVPFSLYVMSNNTTPRHPTSGRNGSKELISADQEKLSCKSRATYVNDGSPYSGSPRVVQGAMEPGSGSPHLGSTPFEARRLPELPEQRRAAVPAAILKRKTSPQQPAYVSGGAGGAGTGSGGGAGYGRSRSAYMTAGRQNGNLSAIGSELAGSTPVAAAGATGGVAAGGGSAAGVGASIRSLLAPLMSGVLFASNGGNISEGGAGGNCIGGVSPRMQSKTQQGSFTTSRAASYSGVHGEVAPRTHSGHSSANGLTGVTPRGASMSGLRSPLHALQNVPTISTPTPPVPAHQIHDV